MNFYGNRHKEKYIYKRVAWDGWYEREQYNDITGGNIEYSTETDLVVTGSFSVEGYDLPDTNDLMRVYYSFVDDNGEEYEHALATLFTDYNDLTYIDTTRGVKVSGTLNGESVLTVLQDKICGAPYIVQRNENATYRAAVLIQECGLQVNYTPGDYRLESDHVFDAGTSYLDIVKWLCEVAGYAYYPDEMGIVQMRSLEEINSSDVSVVFKNDDHSIMYPELVAENAWAETPNVVELLYNVDSCCIAAKARNLSGSRASLDRRGGREKCEFEEIGELSSKGNRLENLMNLAEEELKEKSADVEYVTFKHAWRPIYIWNKIQIEYSDLTWTGTAENIQIELSPATVTQTKIKRQLTSILQIEKTGEYLRGDEDA